MLFELVIILIASKKRCTQKDDQKASLVLLPFVFYYYCYYLKVTHDAKKDKYINTDPMPNGNFKMACRF
jgi:hypothetical protein